MIDCPTKECHWEFEDEDVCWLYLCEPCQIPHCGKEQIHPQKCPILHCVDKTSDFSWWWLYILFCISGFLLAGTFVGKNRCRYI